MLRPDVGRMVIANAREVRLIAQAKIKTDRIDAAVPAQLHASGFLPEVWIPDERTRALRCRVARRDQIVRQRAPQEYHAVDPAHPSDPAYTGRRSLWPKGTSLADRTASADR